jgi:hypothetical protein
MESGHISYLPTYSLTFPKSVSILLTKSSASVVEIGLWNAFLRVRSFSSNDQWNLFHLLGCRIRSPLGKDFVG